MIHSGKRAAVSACMMVCLSVLVHPAMSADGTGLLGMYYPTPDFSGTPQSRIDSTVNFNWGSSGPGIAGIPGEKFSVTWKGLIEPLFSETYTFSLTSDDGLLFLIEGDLLIKNWTDHAPTENTAAIALQKGKKYNIVIKYYQNLGGTAAKLQWSSPSVPKEVVPRERLYPPTANQLTIMTESESRTSPAWFEGTVNEASTKIEVQIAGAAVPVTRSGLSRWYARSAPSGQPLGIPLNAKAPTAVLVKSQEGTATKTATSALTWLVTDLAKMPYGLEVITVRPGDKLLLAATKTGVAKVEIDTNYNGTAFNPVLTGKPNSRFEVPFATPGTYAVRARCDGVEIGKLTVNVVGIDFLGTTADHVGYQRVKDIKILPTVQAGANLVYTANDSELLLVDWKKQTATGAQLTLLPLAKGERIYQVRIGDEFGPIVAQQLISTFTITSSARKTVSVIEQFPDGTIKVQATLTMSPLISGLDVNMRTFVSGVTFDDSTTKKVISTNSFVKDGIDGFYNFKLLRLPLGHANLCHAFTVYQNGVQVSR